MANKSPLFYAKRYRVSTAKRIFIDTPKSIMVLILRYKNYINPKLTYYPEVRHKSSFAVFVDQVKFILKYGFINNEYYTYGLDVRGGEIKQFDFVPERINIDNLLIQNRNYLSKESRAFSYYNHLCLLRDKWVFSKIMEGVGLPVPKSIGVIINKQFIKNGYYEAEDLSELCNTDCNVLLKPVSGNSGKGIIHLIIKSGRVFIKDKNVLIEDLKRILCDDVYIVQEFITNQHSAMNALFSGAVNTLRVTMVRTDKGIELMGVMCLMGAHYAEYSNWHYGGVCINVKQDGCLDKYGFSFSDKRIVCHPDSGVVFDGYQIPYYESAIKMAKKATTLFYGIKAIGWDLAITENGPVFIEGNDGWGIQAHQMVEHRGWKQQYENCFK